jgi:L-fuconate dehydratase
MAIGAVVNAAWDMAARHAGKPVWRLIADMTPAQVVALIDFRYISDALTPAQALAILRAAEAGKAQRLATLHSIGYPAYTTSPGWLGYSDEKLARLARLAVKEGFRTIKIKVGQSIEDDQRRSHPSTLHGLKSPPVRTTFSATQRFVARSRPCPSPRASTRRTV